MYLLAPLCFVAGYLYSSFPEWMVHRYVMHRVFCFFKYKFKYPFERHAIVHHQTFKADVSYELNNHPPEKQEENQITIPMAWWNGPVLIAIASLPFVGMKILNVPWSVVISTTAGIAAYYATYEYIHWCMHKPLNRWFERTSLYKWINGHHRRHHEKMGTNFNVVLPLADFCLGTLYLPKKKKPDVKFKWPPGTKILQ
ncbi:MAG: fatty acid hydroxylase [bacterium]|nr:fatty acid hydroxylase [bacterium]